MNTLAGSEALKTLVSISQLLPESIAYVYTVKLPASQAVLGFVPPVLKMNERAAPELEE